MITGQAVCRHCGRCVLGCPYGAKWDSRRYLDEAIARGANLVTGCRVERLAVRGGRVTGVVSRGPRGRREHPADLVVLAAGGLGTPAILQRSGIGCEPRPFVVQRDHHILSPYFDWFSFLVNPTWRHPAKDLVGMMVKLADEPDGSVTGPRIHKTLTDLDRRRLADGVALATDVLGHFGAAAEDIVLGTVNAGHPGGMLPLSRDSADSFHDDRLPDNVYVADASLFPSRSATHRSSPSSPWPNALGEANRPQPPGRLGGAK
jgi:ferredoxin